MTCSHATGVGGGIVVPPVGSSTCHTPVQRWQIPPLGWWMMDQDAGVVIVTAGKVYVITHVYPCNLLSHT